ncbi:MAG: class I SAM-dependent methyltransferase [Tomitella sp.]|nr:class I SAM-dependent methyltransferase [Tomitella sp.]
MTETADAAADDLPLTGERTVPGISEENYWFRRHEVVYLDLLALCRDRVVVDAGFGEGYGANLIAGVATRVFGVDYDASAVDHVARRYPSVEVMRGNLAALPVGDAAAGVVVNLQVIEHLWDQEQFLRECHRVLEAGGRLIISTPNRITFSPGRETPLNPFHTRELDAGELTGLLEGAGFAVESMRGVHHGPRLAALDARHGGSIIDAQIDRAVAGQPWPAQLRDDVAGVAADDFVLSDTDIDGSLDLVAVAVKPEDSVKPGETAKQR